MATEELYFSSLFLSFSGKIEIRRLLALDNLLAGLPGGRFEPSKNLQWQSSAFASITVARQQGNRTPFRFLSLLIISF
jgi:hypothetical protein